MIQVGAVEAHVPQIGAREVAIAERRVARVGAIQVGEAKTATWKLAVANRSATQKKFNKTRTKLTQKPCATRQNKKPVRRSEFKVNAFVARTIHKRGRIKTSKAHVVGAKFYI